MINSNKENKWLIGIDLDGTFLKDGIQGQRNYNLSKENIKIIKKVIDMGHKVAIITGRPWDQTKIIYDKLKFRTIVANYNGAHIHIPDDKAFIPVVYSMNKNILEKIFNEEIIKKAFNGVIIETINRTFTQEEGAHLAKKIMGVGTIYNYEKWKLGQKVPVDPQNTLIGIKLDVGIHPYEILQTLNRKYGNSMFFRLWDGRNNEENPWVILEINQKASNKGTALEYIASYYNIPLNRTIAFGDGMNDREMLLKASVGVAMKNSKGTIKTYAKDTTDYTNNEAGVGRYLEEFFNIKK
ncbi:MAG: haloacid dehalogenase [Candidatus Tyloplasma litorale]|nr:MAG: haloacid dehalogenase [Mycoplasmatales bacterium]